MGRGLVGVLSSVGLLGLLCALVPGKHKLVNYGPPKPCKYVRGAGVSGGGFCPLQPAYLYLSASYNSLAPIAMVPKHVSQMTMAFFLSSPLFNSLFSFLLNWPLIKLRILAQGFINMCY